MTSIYFSLMGEAGLEPLPFLSRDAEYASYSSKVMSSTFFSLAGLAVFYSSASVAGAGFFFSLAAE